MPLPSEVVSSGAIEKLAGWIEKKGIDGLFFGVVIFLGFVYFLKLIFRPTYESMLHEIKELLIEIKTYIMGKEK